MSKNIGAGEVSSSPVCHFFDFLRHHFHHLLYTLCLVMTALSARVTVLYGDDYYYAAFVRNGHDYFISENILHYRETNGRALVHLFDEILIGLGLWPWRIFIVLCVAVTVLCIARAATRGYTASARNTSAYRLSLSISSLLFMSLNIDVLRQAVFWATGSLNYLFPVMLLLLLYCLLDRDSARLCPGRYWLLPFISLLTGLSTEQASFASLVLILFFFFAKQNRTKKADGFLLFCFGLAFVGFLSLYLAPGNMVRTTFYPAFYEMNILERIEENLKPLFVTVFGKNGIYTPILFALSAFCFSEIPYFKKPFRAVMCTVLALTLVCYTVSLIYNMSLLCFIFLGLSFLCMMADAVCRFIYERDGVPFLFLSGAAVLQGAMLISPVYGARTTLISAALLTVYVIMMTVRIKKRVPLALSLTLSALCLFLVFLSQHQSMKIPALLFVGASLLLSFAFIRRRDVRIPAVALVFAVCLSFSLLYYAGYRENYRVHRLNDAIVETYSASAEDSESLTLYTLPNVNCKWTMPYDDPYHAWRFKLLHGIPEQTELIYIPYDGE